MPFAGDDIVPGFLDRIANGRYDAQTCDDYPTACHFALLLLGAKDLLLEVRVDVVNRLLDGSDLLGFLIRNLAFELFFQSHHQFHRIQESAPRSSTMTTRS